MQAHALDGWPAGVCCKVGPGPWACEHAPTYSAACILPQAKAADGSEAHYITSASSYLRYYASALRSARERAPALLPVLVVLNDMPQDFIDWVEAQACRAGRP